MAANVISVRPACTRSPEVQLRPPRIQNQILHVIGKPPRYSVPQSEASFRALTILVGRLQIGGGREIALATLVGSRLTAGALGPGRLPLKSREARAVSARNWLHTLALPHNVQPSYVRLFEATGTDDIEFMSRSFAEVLDIADEHLDQPSRIEIGRLIHRMSAEQTGEFLNKNGPQSR